MKKIISLLLITVISFSFISVSAVSEDNLEYESFAKAFNLFDYETDEYITRAQFAKTVVNIMLLSDSISNVSVSGIYFTDVDENVPEIDSIKVLTATGYMTGNIVAQGLYQWCPDDTITITEAAKVMIGVLGYSNVVKYYGEYPIGHMSLARSFGLLGGLTDNTNPATVSDIKKLVFNSLNADVATVSVVNDYVKIESQTGVSYINKYWHMQSTTGILTANSLIDIYGRKEQTRYNITIDNTPYTTSLLEESIDYIGMYVTAYVNEDDEVVCMYPVFKKNDTITLCEDIISYGNLKYIEVAVDRNSEKYNIDTNANIYYNFECLGPVRTIDINEVSDKLDKMIDGSSTEVYMVDSNRDGNYDFVWIRSYENIHVTDIDTSTLEISDKYGNNLDINNAYNKNKLFIKGENGIVAPSSIIPDNILSIIKGYNDKNEVVKVFGFVSEKVVSGKITEITDNKYVINDNAYKASKEYLTQMMAGSKKVSTLEIGLNTTFLINEFDEIVGIDKNNTITSSDEMTAFLINIAKVKGIGDTVEGKVLKEDGEVSTVTFDTKVKINNVSKSDSEIFGALSSFAINKTERSAIVYKLVKYKLKNGHINNIEIEVASKTNDRLYPELTLKSTEDIKNIVYKSSTIGKQVGLTTATTIFDVPSEETYSEALSDDEAFMTVPFSDLQNDCVFGFPGQKKSDSNITDAANKLNATMKFYELDNTRFADIAVRYYKYSAGENSSVGYPDLLNDCVTIESISKGINADSEEILIIKGTKAGTNVSVKTTVLKNTSNPWAQFPGISAIELKRLDSQGRLQSYYPTELLPGDVVQVLYNSKGEAINFVINVRGAEHSNAAWLSSGTSLNAGQGNEYLGVNYGEVLEYEDGKVILKELDGSIRVYMIGGITTTVYDRTKKAVSKGSSSSVKKGGDLYIRQYYSIVKEVVYFE